MVGGDGVGDVLEDDGLTGARLRHDEAALALADGRDDVDDAARMVLLGRVVGLHLEPLIGIERREIVEMDLVALLLGVLEIDGVDLEKREVPLALFGAADLAFDGVASAQTESADLRRRDVDVVRASEIVRVGRPQEAEAVLQHLDHARAGDVHLAGGELFQNREHELLLAHGARVLDFDLLGEAQELRRRLGLQILQLHFLHALLLQTEKGESENFRISRGVRDIVEGGGVCLGGTAACNACSSPSDPIFFGRKAGSRQRPGMDATRLIADPQRDAERDLNSSLERADNHQNDDQDHQDGGDLVNDAVETRAPRVSIRREVLGPLGEQATEA